jgi:phosphate transport system substrate-binding protein
MRRTLTAIAACALAVPVLAQDVTLTSRDGAIALSGTLLSFDGEFYRVETEFGALTVDGSGVVCDGPGCPGLGAFVAELSLAAPQALSARLAPALVAGFAAAEGYELRVGADEARFDLVEPATGATVGRLSILSTASAAEAAAALADEGGADFALTRSEGARGEVVALDALVAVVARDNRLLSLRFDQIGDVLSGRISDWSALGGAEMPVRVVLPPSGTPVRDRIGAMFPDIGAGVTVSDDPASEALADPFALAFVPLTEADEARVVSFLGPCGFPKTATPEALKTEDYPLILPVFLEARGGRLPRLGREFFAFARSEAAQEAIRTAGFVDQSLDRIPFGSLGDRLANAVTVGADSAGLDEVQRMVGDLRDHDRLTVTFRFRDGSSELDSHSLSNVALMADAFDRGVFDTADLIVAGFSDGQGDAASNLRLSRQRARAVREAILAAMTPPVRDAARAMEVRGYGEAAPIACDEVDWGRRLNRRVEIWVRQR